MTTFQGQSAKRHSNKKNFKSGQNQWNATFIFITFRNHRPIIFVSFHICKSRRIRKSHKKRAPEVGMPAEWQDGETSLKQEKMKIRWNFPKCYIPICNFPESAANNFYVISHLQVSQNPKIPWKKAPELGMPTGWQQSEVSLRIISQFIKIEWNRKRNEMETYFWWVSVIADETFWVFLFQMFMYGRFLKSRKKWKRVFLKLEPVVSESRASRWTFVLILEVDEFSITVSDVPSKVFLSVFYFPKCVYALAFLMSELVNLVIHDTCLDY